MQNKFVLKYKKTQFSGPRLLIVGCFVSFAINIVPLPVQAGFFSFFKGDEELKAAPIESSVNTQTMSLLQPAINTNPNPIAGKTDFIIERQSVFFAQTGPQGAMADIETGVSNNQISIYTVKSGDTLSGIAKMFGVSVNTILWANNLSSNSSIREGQELIILPTTGVRHTVVSGETLSGIAKKYKADLQEVAEYNNISVKSLLSSGTVLIIPDADIVVPITQSIASKSTPSLSGYFSRPLKGGVKTQGLHGNNAVDIADKLGTSVYAAASGKVLTSISNGGWNHGYGNYIVISHPNGTQTLYAHLSENTVSSGMTVDKGEKIGAVGNTGKSTGPHLHFEVRGARNPF